MERLLAWYRVTSSVGAVVALIAANAIPLLGFHLAEHRKVAAAPPSTVAGV